MLAFAETPKEDNFSHIGNSFPIYLRQDQVVLILKLPSWKAATADCVQPTISLGRWALGMSVCAERPVCGCVSAWCYSLQHNFA